MSSLDRPIPYALAESTIPYRLAAARVRVHKPTRELVEFVVPRHGAVATSAPADRRSEAASAA